MAVRSGERKVVVRLSDVPEVKRVAVAERIIRVEGIEGTAAMRLKMAALVPTQNPELEVPVAVARRVCGRGFA